jgi:nitrogen fixation/metabolism regulation signal transduction histidine kinase
MLLLATVLLVGLLTVAATSLARTLARPVRELVDATGRISAGDYETRLEPRTGDEVADLVRGFNNMAASLSDQRADLERRKDYMETLLRHATTGVVSTDPEGRLVTLNPAARELLAPAADRIREGEALAAALADSKELSPLADFLRAGPRHGEAEEIDLEGEPQPRRYRVVRIELPDPAGSGTVGSLILLDDVTELMRSNQLAAWAEMARAIAHEIKNPLTPIQLSTEHLHRLLHDRGVLPSPPMEACLQTVIKQVRTLHEIAGAFSTYAKLPQLAPQPTDPVTFMQEAVEPYRVSSPPNVTIEEQYEPSGPVSIDTRVLTRAVVNLVENALEAMPDGGRLRFTVAPDGRGGESVVLSVSDTGKGLDAEARRRLFEPYFSTKSSGTGLGLAIVRKVVEAHQGTIEIDSASERGTTFRIVLPTVGRAEHSPAEPG